MYEWIASPWEVDIATADDNVYDFLDYIQRNGSDEVNARKENGKFSLPAEIKSGERDKTLFRYASHLRSIGRRTKRFTMPCWAQTSCGASRPWTHAISTAS